MSRDTDYQCSVRLKNLLMILFLYVAPIVTFWMHFQCHRRCSSGSCCWWWWWRRRRCWCWWWWCTCISAHLGAELEDYIQQHLSGVVQLIRTKQREGLIRARIFGADHATGDVRNCSLNIQFWSQSADNVGFCSVCSSCQTFCVVWYVNTEYCPALTSHLKLICESLFVCQLVLQCFDAVDHVTSARPVKSSSPTVSPKSSLLWFLEWLHEKLTDWTKIRSSGNRQVYMSPVCEWTYLLTFIYTYSDINITIYLLTFTSLRCWCSYLLILEWFWDTGVTASEALELAEDRWFWRTIATAEGYGWTLRVLLGLLLYSYLLSYTCF